uniref:Alternative protein ENPEP n=1 Tax=Homo sapiens TaxID=9606 RepID=L8E9Y3_HUMAN|nr:alternative protein ENPEP [Homo sapiens]
MNQQMPGNLFLVLMSPTKRQLIQYLSPIPKNTEHFQICQWRKKSQWMINGLEQLLRSLSP